MMKHLGITGTRDGLSLPQAAALRALLVDVSPTWMHNGLAGGVDAQAAQMAQELGILIHGHPSTHGPDIAAQALTVRCEAPLPPLERNRAIVAASEVLVACPGQYHELLRSGTWATVRYARQAGLSVRFCWPNGTTDKVAER